MGGVCAQGRVKFEGLAVAAGFPEDVRVAVFIPSLRKLCVTDAVKVSGPYCYLRADLLADGSGRLAVLKVLPWRGLDLLTAVALTLLVEVLVVIAHDRRLQTEFQRKFDAKSLTDREFRCLADSSRLPKCLGLCLLLNLLTIPVLWWFVTRAYQEQSAAIGHLSLAGAELLAGVFEGLGYAWIAKLGLRRGLVLGLVANAASFAVGLLV